MFDYYGSKNILARYYQRPRYPLIVEPFAGSASYSVWHLARNMKLHALLMDKDVRVCAAWRWLKEQTPESIRALRTPKEGEVTSNFFEMTTSASTASLNCKKMTVSARMARRIPRMWAKISGLLWILPRIEVRWCSYEECEDLEATWFIDPPYQQTGSGLHGNGYGKDCRAKDLDFARLGEWCLGRKGQVIVTEKEGADWLPFKPIRYAKDSLDKRYVEMVWNSEPDEQMEFDF